MAPLDVQDDVGADVYPWPPSPMAPLDVQGKVGADVYLWPRSPMAPLDVQRDAIKIALRTLFSLLLEEQKSAQRGDVPVRLKPGRGSLERLSNVGFSHAHGAEICPLSAITLPFPLARKSVRERDQDRQSSSC
jgi:hypothetical protein